MKRILTVLLGLLLVTDAFAQTPTQPVYVRQARLTPIEVFDSAVASGTAATSTRIWDMAAFVSATIQFVPVSGCGLVQTFSFEVTGALQYIRVRWVYTGLIDGGPLQILVQTSPTSAFTSGLANQIGSETVTLSSSGCTFDVYMVLNPFSTLIDIKTVAGTVTVTGDVVADTPTGAATAIPPNSITTVETVYSFDGTKRVTLQNNGTGAMLCAVTSNAALAVDSTNYDFSLAASSAVNDGTGGSITLPYIPLTAYYLRCVALSGTAIAAGFAHL